jgi:uncharacterized protein
MSRAARATAALAFAGASAFCAAQQPATSARITVAPEVPNPSLAIPGKSQPPGPAKPIPAPPKPVPRDVTDIALVLPLQSPDYARAAEAVRDGFLAAAEAAGELRRVRVIGHADGNVVGGFEGAKSLGARVVVGPLVRDDLRALAASDRSLPLTLALNQLDEGAALPPQIYTLALAVESDARVLARRMRADNVQKTIVIGGDAPLMKRFANAFAGEWLLAGGGPPQGFAFDASVDGLSVLRRELAKTAADGALIALDGPPAALARSFVPRLPAYASSLVNQGLEPATARDLEGVMFVDLPWIVTPNHPSLSKLPRRPRENLVLERLYALGLDAFEIARGFTDGVPERLQIAGATGRLTLAEGRYFVREGTLAVFRQGLVVPADAR